MVMRMGIGGGFDELDASGNVIRMTVMIHGRKKKMAAACTLLMNLMNLMNLMVMVMVMVMVLH